MGSRHGPTTADADHEPLCLAETRFGARVCDPQQGRFMERRAATSTVTRRMTEQNGIMVLKNFRRTAPVQSFMSLLSNRLPPAQSQSDAPRCTRSVEVHGADQAALDAPGGLADAPPVGW